MPKRKKNQGRVKRKKKVAKSKIMINARKKLSPMERKRKQETG